MGEESCDGRKAVIQSMEVKVGLYRKKCGKYICLLNVVWGSPTSAMWVQVGPRVGDTLNTARNLR